MHKTFTSPQTGSEYRVIAEYPEQEALVAFRYLEEDSYRVRVQGTEMFLQTILCQLRGWGDIKNGDHISVVVNADDLRVAIAEVLIAAGYVTAYVLLDIYEARVEDEDEDEDEDITAYVLPDIYEDEDEDDYPYRAEY